MGLGAKVNAVIAGMSNLSGIHQGAICGFGHSLKLGRQLLRL
jgi:hypothetical protein